MVRYYFEDIKFQYNSRRFNNAWLRCVAEREQCRLADLNIIFCSDPYLLNINLQYLGNDYYTDIITFDYSEKPVVSGDLFISVDTVRDNASFYGAGFDEELHLVIVHGLLHLIGYDDHTDADIAQMRLKENESLSLRQEMLLEADE
jgi:rRNA maturation RNase YbeY